MVRGAQIMIKYKDIDQGYNTSPSALQVVATDQGPTSPKTTLFLLSYETLLVHSKTPLQEEIK